jgi:cytochrome P450
MEASFNLADPTLNETRYEHYDSYREATRALWYAKASSWLIFRHEDVAALAKSSLVTTNHLVREKITDEMLRDDPALAEIVGTISKWMIYNEAPNHPRLRAFMNTTFTRAYIERVRTRISTILERRMQTLRGRTDIDFVTDIAHPVPAEILATMLGLDEIEIDLFLRWSDAIADFMQDFVVSPAPNKQIAANTARNLLEMKDALRRAISDRRRSPKEDLLTDLSVATSAGEASITEEELTLQLVHLIFGGHKIPQFVLANTLHLLLLNREHLMLGDDASFEAVGRAVDESMRVESPIQFITRHAVADFDLGDQRIRQGDSLYLMLGSANRDPAVYTNPNTFLPGGQRKKGIHYGTGHHACIGAALSNVTIAEILSHFLRSLSSIEPCYDLERPMWTQNDTFHGVDTMPVKVSFR